MHLFFLFKELCGCVKKEGLLFMMENCEFCVKKR